MASSTSRLWGETVGCVPTAGSQTEGPYWIDERLHRSDLRNDPSDGSAKPGVPLELAIRVHEISGSKCAPLTGVQVDLWQCDAAGLYSDVPQNRTQGLKFLRGYQVSDASGTVRFRTIYPGWYHGRTVHIHVRVRQFLETGTKQFTSQLYFDDDITDHIFMKDPYNQRGRRDVLNKNDRVLEEIEGTILYPKLVSNGFGFEGSLDMGIDFNKERSKRRSGPQP